VIFIEASLSSWPFQPQISMPQTVWTSQTILTVQTPDFPCAQQPTQPATLTLITVSQSEQVQDLLALWFNNLWTLQPAMQFSLDSRIDKVFKKLRLVVQVYNNHRKKLVLTQSLTIQCMSQRLTSVIVAILQKQSLGLYLYDISQIYIQLMTYFNWYFFAWPSRELDKLNISQSTYNPCFLIIIIKKSSELSECRQMTWLAN
jgi:hypothetical protein